MSLKLKTLVSNKSVHVTCRKGQPYFHLKLAGRVVRLYPRYPFLREYCQDYLTEEPQDFSVEISRADIDYERRKSAGEAALEGIPVRQFSDAYLETLAACRAIAVRMLDYDTLLFHGSALSLDGVGYLFTAKSGTGKSTHARLWRERFGERVTMVNDDKPFLRITEKGILVCGSPWDGKHRLSNNIEVPLKAICILNRDEGNHIESARAGMVYPALLQQAYRPSDPMGMAKTLELVDRLAAGTELYILGCNMSPDAPLAVYEGMNGVKTI